MKKLIGVIILILGIVIAIFFASPYYAAYQLNHAYETKDGHYIATSIDYQRLKPNIKQQLTQSFADTLSRYPLIKSVGGSGVQNTANAFIDMAVNNAVTPQNIEHLVATQGQANLATKQLVAAWVIANNQIDLQALLQQLVLQKGDLTSVLGKQLGQIIKKPAAQLQNTPNNTQKPQLNYCGINCFKISSQIKGYDVLLELQRHELFTWQITNVTVA